MQIFVPRETDPGEPRVSLLPRDVEKLAAAGADIEVEANTARSLGLSDDEYRKAGARISSDADASFKAAGMVLRLRKPSAESLDLLKEGCIHVSYLDPFREPALVRKLREKMITGISMEMIPRTTVAQKMDALSSQANLAGYYAVVLAAERIDKVFPMMMTPAGTLSPCRVFVIGVGVAGLQAIATAKRLGARVEAFDTRPVVEEQVQSLGAKFVKVDLGETGQTKQGYAREFIEQLARQREAMARHCAQADIVITTAQLFGRPAPRIVTRDMVERMRPGSLLVDLAVESGGNVEGSEVDKEVDVNGVRILGISNMPGRVATHASEMYSSNVRNLVSHFWDKEKKAFDLDLEDEILQGCVITHAGEIRNEMIRNHMEKESS